MSSLNGLLVIIRSPAGQSDRRETVRATWGRDLVSRGATVLFSVQDPERSQTELEGDVLWVPGPDAHWNLTDRMAWTFRWYCASFQNVPQSPHLLSLDDDCYVIADRLAGLPWRDSDVYGHKNDAWYWAGGPGIFFSPKVVHWLNYFMGRDDCMIGALLTAAGPREFRTADAGTRLRPWREGGWPAPDNNTAVQHYVREPSEMVELHKTWGDRP